MQYNKKNTLKLSVLASLVSISVAGTAQASLYDALAGGKAFADFRLRYESVDQENPVEDADALTLRTRLGYTTGNYNGFSAVVELEDNRIVGGQGDFTVGPTGFNPGLFSVIADPEHTELDQGFVQYKNESVTVKVGRQVIALDGQRFVGHVGWRQDRQTFDALRVIYSPVEGLTLDYSYVDQRNRIFGEEADFDSKDHLFNASYKLGSGKLVGYAYLLEIDNDTDNSLDTYGISYTGGIDLSGTKLSYKAEFATQSSETATTDFDADYLGLEVGATFSGVTAKVGYESLGSDDGAFGFSTPLATLHKFNGFADIFLRTPNQGLVDTYVGLSGNVGGGKLTATYHMYDADESMVGADDFGDEINLLYVRKFAKHYTLGVKYAAFSAEDIAVDTDKLMVWVQTKF
ncbi:MAG: alginate export family protein [Pseudomonadota bacterium]